MTYQEIYDALCETGLPVALNRWDMPRIPDLPYIVFTYPQNNDFRADDINYAEIVQLEVGLYTKRKNIALEHSVEAVLTEHFGAFFKSSDYVPADAVQETLYTTEVAITNGEQN